MTWEDIHRFFASLWVVWLLVLFVGIVAWVYWPPRRKILESHGRIPLQDEDEER